MSNLQKCKREGSKRVVPVTGLSALLVIFAVLCLVVFSILSISTVRADQNLADRMITHTLAYYEADSEAETILARLRNGEVPEEVIVVGTDEESGSTVYAFTCEVSDTQCLEVAVAVDASRPNSYKIFRWQLLSSTDWQADESLNLWGGE